MGGAYWSLDRFYGQLIGRSVGWSGQAGESLGWSGGQSDDSLVGLLVDSCVGCFTLGSSTLVRASCHAYGLVLNITSLFFPPSLFFFF